MQGNFKECLDLVLKSEGGYINHPSDPGGRTNFGVTQRVWEEYTGHEADEKIMRGLTPEKVAPLYEQRYWRPCYGEILPKGLDFLCFSFGVNAGSGRAVKLLQQSLGLVSDGIIGPRVMQKLRESNIADVIKGFSESRREYYKSLKTFPIFGKGWIARTDREEQEALQMVKNA
jgi:lysozyme family protein